jgi:pyridoxine kinase
MASVLCLSSHVARGAIGLGATVPALEALGHHVTTLPTVLLSNHPGHPSFAKQEVPPSFLRDTIAVYEKAGWLASFDAVLTGYMPTVEHVAAARFCVERVRIANPRLIYLADPVLGDDPGGLYISDAAAMAVRDQLVSVADYITPNRFEASWLSGIDVTSEASATDAAMVLKCATTIVTSVPVDDRALIGTVLVSSDKRADVFRTRRFERVPHGTGDLFAGLFLGKLLRGQPVTGAVQNAVNGVALTAADSQGCDELDLTLSRAKWLDI